MNNYLNRRKYLGGLSCVGIVSMSGCSETAKQRYERLEGRLSIMKVNMSEREYRVDIKLDDDGLEEIPKHKINLKFLTSDQFFVYETPNIINRKKSISIRDTTDETLSDIGIVELYVSVRGENTNYLGVHNDKMDTVKFEPLDSGGGEYIK